MAGYQVYLPKQRGADPELLRAVGLGDILDPERGPSAYDVLGNGPDGGAGVCFFWGDTTPGVRLDSQEWSPAKASGDLPEGRFWLGKEKAEPPTPDDLMRVSHLGGGLVQLDDGNDWVIPIAQRVPHRVSLDAEGNPVMVPKRPYQRFYAKSAEFYQAIMAVRSDPLAELRLSGAWPFAVESLQMNYRVNADVIDWLELLDDINIIRLIGATFEMGVMLEIEAQKKTA